MRRFHLYRVLLVCALLLPCAFLPAENARAEGDFGDANGDGLVSAADAAVLMRDVRGGKAARENALEQGDLTQSGTLDDTDVRAWLAVSAGLIPDTVAFAERVATGLCPEAEFLRFRYTEPLSSDTRYQSDSVSMEIIERSEGGVAYFIADIYIQDVTCFRTAFSNDTYEGAHQFTTTIASAVDAIVAINGDYYNTHSFGPTVRNGDVYRRGVYEERDTAVLTCDGVLATYGKHELTRESLAEMNVFQAWVFGPELLDGDGAPLTTFNSRLGAKNPRAAIGYYAPGHYCFVLVDGRQKHYSSGMTFTELATLFSSLGCRAAYNLDGGQTAMMATAAKLINQPYKNGRPVSDIVYISEPAL